VIGRAKPLKHRGTEDAEEFKGMRLKETAEKICLLLNNDVPVELHRLAQD
jgi:hypothetical protein